MSHYLLLYTYNYQPRHSRIDFYSQISSHPPYLFILFDLCGLCKMFLFNYYSLSHSSFLLPQFTTLLLCTFFPNFYFSYVDTPNCPGLIGSWARVRIHPLVRDLGPQILAKLCFQLHKLDLFIKQKKLLVPKVIFYFIFIFL